MSTRKLFLQADTPEELLGILLHTPAVVSPLGYGQKTSDVERWAIRRFLATCETADLFDYPVRVESGERPDFVVSSSFGSVGVEVSQAVPPDLAKIRDIERRERNNPTFASGGEGGLVETSTAGTPEYRLFDPGANMTAAQARQIAQSSPSPVMLAPGSSKVAANWIEAMLWRIDRKNAGFTYTRQDRNVLLIDDQWPSPVLQEDEAFAQLVGRLASRENSFDDIFVDRERSRNMLRFGAREGITPIPLWC